MDQTLELERERSNENPSLVLRQCSLGCYFGEEDSETGSGMIYEGIILHEPDSTEIITASAKVY
jgi:hypothetical protein